MSRFIDYDAKTSTAPQALIVGLTGPSFSGKTNSALRLATGMQRVVGGEIGFVDTESNRGLQYKNDFAFRHVPFAPPHSPAAYEEAIDYCVGRGFKIVVIDSMSHEHSGEGGVLDQIEDYMAKHDWKESYKWAAHIEPKAQRRRLNRRIVGLGGQIIFVLCYRAVDKIKPAPKGSPNKEPVHLGYQAETTSSLPYEMTVRFLLPPASDGRPNLTPDTEFEKLSIKMPGSFREWFKPGLQLTEDLGERLARWSVGETVKTQSDNPLAVELRRLRWDKQKIEAYLATYNVSRLSELTPGKAIEVLAELKSY